MATQWLLKLDREDDDQGYVLVRVTSKEGSNDLDLDLLATEGEEVFKGKLKNDDLESLRSKNYNGKEGDWEAILKFGLLEGKSTAISLAQKQSLEVGASVQEKTGRKSLSITFRNRVDDITQRIGAIELTQSAKMISLFDWAALAMDKKNELEGELLALTLITNEDKATIAQLQAQLADLVKVKAEHEEELLSRFVVLLNDKKTKIRDQQRLLQTAKVDEERLQRLKSSMSPGTSRSTTRNVKRPAPDEDDNEYDSSQAFETQQSQRGEPNEEEVEPDRQTTPDSTESEAESDDELPVRAQKTSPRKASPKSTRRAAPRLVSIPPPRALPFAAKSGHNTRFETQPKAPEPAPDDDEETASEDDEL